MANRVRVVRLLLVAPTAASRFSSRLSANIHVGRTNLPNRYPEPFHTCLGPRLRCDSGVRALRARAVHMPEPGSQSTRALTIDGLRSQSTVARSAIASRARFRSNGRSAKVRIVRSPTLARTRHHPAPSRAAAVLRRQANALYCPSQLPRLARMDRCRPRNRSSRRSC